MKVEKIENEALGEKYYRAVHPSGLTIIVLPKEDYASAYAVFAVKYGSIDTKIELPDGGFAPIPEGTAHFLEHKLFESEEVAAFDRFAKTGAYANAYTSFDRTAYLFSCSTNFRENLEILLDFVSKPYFTEETVQKEQGIIGQEIRMYRDVPDWEVMFNLLRALYHEHPVRIDIAGTEESIAGITAEMLYKCHANFYNLSNMVLAVAGNVSPDEVFAIADKSIVVDGARSARREFVREPSQPKQELIEEKLAVGVPQFLLGCKRDIENPERTVSEKMCANLLLDIIAGKASPLYKELLEGGMINTGFGFELLDGFGYSCVMLGGESKEPYKTAERIKAEIARLKREGISEKAFERSRKKLYGRLVMLYNDVDDVANHIADAHFNGCGVFEELEVCKKLTLADVSACIEEIFDESRFALSVILPK